MKRVVFLIVMLLFATECFGGRFFNYGARYNPRLDPCYNPCFNPCFDPCFDPCEDQCKPVQQSKLSPIPDSSTSPLPSMEGKTSPIEVLKNKVIESPLEGKTSPLPAKEGDTSPLPTKFFDGTEEIKPEPDLLPVPFDDTWNNIGKTPKLKIHYKYKVEDIHNIVVRTPKGRFLSLPVINGMLPVANISGDKIDIFYRGKKATAKFWSNYKKLGYCQYHKPVNMEGWHLYTGQPMREWTYLGRKFNGVLHSAKRDGETNANIRIITLDGKFVTVKWSDLAHGDQSYVSGSYDVAGK